MDIINNKCDKLYELILSYLDTLEISSKYFNGNISELIDIKNSIITEINGNRKYYIIVNNFISLVSYNKNIEDIFVTNLKNNISDIIKINDLLGFTNNIKFIGDIKQLEEKNIISDGVIDSNKIITMFDSQINEYNNRIKLLEEKHIQLLENKSRITLEDFCKYEKQIINYRTQLEELVILRKENENLNNEIIKLTSGIAKATDGDEKLKIISQTLEEKITALEEQQKVLNEKKDELNEKQILIDDLQSNIKDLENKTVKMETLETELLENKKENEKNLKQIEEYKKEIVMADNILKSKNLEVSNKQKELEQLLLEKTKELEEKKTQVKKQEELLIVKEQQLEQKEKESNRLDINKPYIDKMVTDNFFTIYGGKKSDFNLPDVIDPNKNNHEHKIPSLWYITKNNDKYEYNDGINVYFSTKARMDEYIKNLKRHNGKFHNKKFIDTLGGIIHNNNLTSSDTPITDDNIGISLPLKIGEKSYSVKHELVYYYQKRPFDIKTRNLQLARAIYIDNQKNKIKRISKLQNIEGAKDKLSNIQETIDSLSNLNILLIFNNNDKLILSIKNIDIISPKIDINGPEIENDIDKINSIINKFNSIIDKFNNSGASGTGTNYYGDNIKRYIWNFDGFNNNEDIKLSHSGLKIVITCEKYTLEKTTMGKIKTELSEPDDYNQIRGYYNNFDIKNNSLFEYKIEFPTFGANPKLLDCIKNQISFLNGENNDITNLRFSPLQWSVIINNYS